MRVVSLVPSATETLRALGVEPLACTRFCEQPGLPIVGGTKNPDVTEIVALQPDLVVVNDEENRAEDAKALAAAGVELHSMSPRSVSDVGPAVTALASAIGANVPAPFDRWEGWVAEQTAPSRASVATMVWRRPWMTMNDDTYGSSVLQLLGFENVFGADPTRYPETTLDDVAARHPDLVLLPSEPYPFTARHVSDIEAALPDTRVRLVDGRDLFWWGIRTPHAVGRLRERDVQP
ncbi:MAG TPA: helical backbone metal receptor [Acidimicrobiia bacterium]|nr:helical backbone metal receptor [Acidimicrobiia bacterium]